MKRDTISAGISLLIIAVSSALGVASVGRTQEKNIPENNTQIIYDNSVSFTETGEYPPVIFTFSQTVQVSSVSGAIANTAVSVSSSEITVSESSYEVTSTSVQTDVPKTEVAVTEEVITEVPQIQDTEPVPEPKPEPKPEPTPEPEPEPPVLTEAQTEKSDVEYIPESATEFQREVLRIVNEKRRELGIRPLSGSEALNRAADIRAEEIFRNFDHVRPDGSGWYTIYAEVGVAPGYMGENIAAGRSTPAEVFDQWLNSPDHYANMISENYTNMGVGYFETDSEYHHYWVQLFS